ncbi:hypothetical protein GCM10027187_40630 [Streptosporangium sandarakinum]|uniref:Uncharacterized protein n=1 Tax=Streptosporangium sandarakinum TaxID=1260955 RepID=A0A852V455_9ACTN|nr:hypothetical protein [Streptosporangium sandarakinum]NYF44607.1 hypothetical protein [Streptosporangium sandarakinum]
MSAGESIVAVLRWACAAMPLAMPAAAACYLLGVRVGRAAAARELVRLERRLETFTVVLRPLADAVRVGEYNVALPVQDMAVLALLVDEPGGDGDTLAALERAFHGSDPPTH